MERDTHGQAEGKAMRGRGGDWSQEPPEAERGKEVFFRALRGSVALPAPEFWTSGLQNSERGNLGCFKPCGLW